MLILGKLLYAIVVGTLCAGFTVALFYCLGWFGWRMLKFFIWLVEGKPRWARFAVLCAIASLYVFSQMLQWP